MGVPVFRRIGVGQVRESVVLVLVVVLPTSQTSWLWSAPRLRGPTSSGWQHRTWASSDKLFSKRLLAQRFELLCSLEGSRFVGLQALSVASHRKHSG